MTASIAFWHSPTGSSIELSDEMFQWPSRQEDNSTHWKPTFFDFFYVSFTNSIAFSPTDAMPMTRQAKLLMLVESAFSAVAILLVAARAVNIFR